MSNDKSLLFYEFLKENGPVFGTDEKRQFPNKQEYYQKLILLGKNIERFVFDGGGSPSNKSNVPRKFSIYFLEQQREKAKEKVFEKFPETGNYKGRYRQLSGLFQTK